MDRGIIDYPQTNMESCMCGASMTNISLHYGRTPFGLFCSVCKTTYLNKITNCDVDGAVRIWNLYRTEGRNDYDIKPLQYKCRLHDKPRCMCGWYKENSMSRAKERYFILIDDSIQETCSCLEDLKAQLKNYSAMDKVEVIKGIMINVSLTVVIQEEDWYFSYLSSFIMSL